MKLSITIAQLNFLVGDVGGNTSKILEAIQKAEALGSDLILFPELALSGYPPEDLLLRGDFLNAIKNSLDLIRGCAKKITVVLGFPEFDGQTLYNSAAIFESEKLVAIYRKQRLPNYGVFDEKRYFDAGTGACIYKIRGIPIGITICEDAWEYGPVESSIAAGAQIILNLNASPYHQGKSNLRELAAHARISASKVPMVYANLVGGQDELLFDGRSFVMNGAGSITHEAEAFKEELLSVSFEGDHALNPVGTVAPTRGSERSEVYAALVLGIKDYTTKNGFKGALLGLSGGIDSALTLALAVDALGKENVTCVSMPSRYTADMSNEDATLQANLMGCEHLNIPIEPAFNAFMGMLSGPFSGAAMDVTEENIQARCRGIILMALSNKQGKLLLTTGNKSEMSVGYATLYGDMAGGFAPLKDVPKCLVYDLCEYRNTIAQVIPRRVIERPPSAELRPDQKDQDSLPPYEILDQILERYIELDQSIEEIIAAGLPSQEVKRIIQLIHRNEYKRRQSPPGIKISPRAFGKDRRYPITSGFGRN